MRQQDPALQKLGRLLEYGKLASARLNHIDEALIASFIHCRIKQVKPATVNRELATLRRLLYLAQRWKIIDRVPQFEMLKGERERDFVLSHSEEELYLEVAPPLLRDVAILLLDTGLLVGEAFDLNWADIHLTPARGAKFGYLSVQKGKSKNAKRVVSLTPRVKAMLEKRRETRNTPFVFPARNGQEPMRVTSMDHVHSKVRKGLQMDMDFVLYSLRHTMLTRLGEAGAGAFTIMKIAGHSSITVSQRYVHPTPETLERAFERLEALNAEARGESDNEEKLLPVPAKSTTLEQESS